MRIRPLRRKPMIVDIQHYEASISGNLAGDDVTLRVTIRADFGTRSFVTIEGLRSYYFWDRYCSAEGLPAPSESLQITPRLLAALIGYSREQGWNPQSETENRRLEVTNAAAHALLAKSSE